MEVRFLKVVTAILDAFSIYERKTDAVGTTSPTIQEE